MDLWLVSEIHFNRSDTYRFNTGLIKSREIKLRQISKMSRCTSQSEREFPDQTEPTHVLSFPSQYFVLKV